ncbi:MAG: TVP38/TMEM64 family protein [Proteobacteria bacterium]|nr:TVP38/TMEM64 family protein [Pseudomonadota bacterium]MBU4296394.1 TVP38/TMEM64 family protein [Pseudomonadota bacterium]MCG2750077.1 TVP38/TMEM64 family protein [Desulfobulbaceae bacterium]
MKTNTGQNGKTKGRGALKAAVLVLFIGAAIVLVRYTPAKEYLSPAQVNAMLETTGIWAPAAYIFFYAAGVCLFVPGTLLTAVGAAVFGPYQGFVYVWLGAMLGAAGAFLIGRYLGRDFAASLVGPRLQKYDEAIGRNGFATVLYLRLAYFPFTPMNFGMGLTRVKFGDYLLGTGIGILAGTFILTFFIGTLRQVWASGDWSRLNSWQTYLSVSLFIFSFFLPKIARKMRREKIQ